MAEYLDPIDISNRALQHCGTPRFIDKTQGFNEDSVQASACGFAYGKQRRFELRRNIWRFSIRWAVLRPITDTSRLLAPTLWAAGTTYAYGALVTDVAGVIWQSLRHGNIANEPGKVNYWELYTGPLSIPEWVSTESYFRGDVVYQQDGDGGFTVFMSLEPQNTDNPATPNAYDDEVTYRKGDLVLYDSVVYQSSIDFNLNNQPDISSSAWTTSNRRGTGSEKWVQLSCDLIDQPVIVPASHGPTQSSAGRYLFRYPANYLRTAVQDPKRGVMTPYGGPGNRWPNDWMPEGDYFSSMTATPIVLRFVADIQNVQAFDDMFCEGLAAKLALAIAPTVTQDSVDTNRIAAEYQKWMTEARTVNAIEQGSVEATEDEYITARY
jgi:hypothetical protein